MKDYRLYGALFGISQERRQFAIEMGNERTRLAHLKGRQTVLREDEGVVTTGLVGRNHELGGVLGAIGECVVADYLGIEWVPLKPIGLWKKEPDVGPYDVRTGSEPWHNLTLRASDAADREHILVLPGPTKLVWNVVGKILGSEGMIDCYLRKDRGDPPFWIIPRRKLRGV